MYCPWLLQNYVIVQKYFVYNSRNRGWPVKQNNSSMISSVCQIQDSTYACLNCHLQKIILCIFRFSFYKCILISMLKISMSRIIYCMQCIINASSVIFVLQIKWNIRYNYWNKKTGIRLSKQSYRKLWWYKTVSEVTHHNLDNCMQILLKKESVIEDLSYESSRQINWCSYYWDNPI